MEEQNIEDTIQITEVLNVYQEIEKHIKYLESNLLEEEENSDEEGRI